VSDSGATLVGLDALQKTLADMAEEAPLRAAAGSLEEAGRILKAAQGYCPVDTGALRDSGRAGQDGDGGALVEFTADHAVRVHEDLSAHHKSGQAKFLERATNEAQAGFADRMGQALAKGGAK